MSDTIFYKGKLKKGKDPVSVFEKIGKGIGKKGPTKNWVCTMDEGGRSFRIDFPDGKSETFVLEFNEKGEFNHFCKVFFPLEGELYEDGKSEFKALLDALYRAKSLFASIEIRDDYELAERYWKGKGVKVDFRNLTAEEEARVRRLYAEGNTTHKQLLLAIMAEDMELSVDELQDYANIDINFHRAGLSQIQQTFGTYLYETAEYQKEGRLCEIPDSQYYEIGGPVYLAEDAFVEGICRVFSDGELNRTHSPKDAQVRRLFIDIFTPLFMREQDPLEKCVLAYRYFVSVYDFLGFHYVGGAKNVKTVMDLILEEYGEEKGGIFLTCFCTSGSRFGWPATREESLRLILNMQERYGVGLVSEYGDFIRKYGTNIRFRHESEYMAFVQFRMQREIKYIDDSLIV